MPNPLESAETRALKLLIEECFVEADARFLEHFRKISDGKWLGIFANKWKADARPWARQQLLEYLLMPFDARGHAPVVRKLFKHAEAAKDDEVMAAFMVAFDKIVRRERRTAWRFDWKIRQSYQQESLYSPRNNFRSPLEIRNPRTGELVVYEIPQPKSPRLFRYKSRYYLRRRVWRYFRMMGWQRPDAYVGAICKALRLYSDADLLKGENLLDSWSLMHACFAHSPAIKRGRERLSIMPDRSLSHLSPAPYFPQLWATESSMKELLHLAISAAARAVRQWAQKLFLGQHNTIPVEVDSSLLLRMLDHSDAEIQAFGAQLIRNLPGREQWTIGTWLRLLEMRNFHAQTEILAEAKRLILPDRLSLDQCLSLLCANSGPVAAWGWELLGLMDSKGKLTSQTPLLAGVCRLQAAHLADKVVPWALTKLIPNEEVYATHGLDWVTGFFDSNTPAVREESWQWLTDHPTNPAYDDPALWSRLAETPYDDLRQKLVRHLAFRSHLAATSKADLRPVWTSVLLGVHRGGRTKAAAAQQVARAIAEDMAKADSLLPVLKVVVRSVRAPERRAGLSAVTWLADQSESLHKVVAQSLPELRWLDPCAPSAV